MQIKMYQALRFRQFYQSIHNKQMPLKVAYKMNKLLASLDKEAEFYQTKFAEIVEKYAEKDEKGQYVMNDAVSVKVQEDKLDACQDEMTELQNLDITIEDCYFTLDELESLNVEVGEMQSLMPFIKE